VGALLSICRKVTAKGCAIILVTHKLAEVAEIAHRTTVLRRGKLVETFRDEGRRYRSLVSSMVGRDCGFLYVSSASVPEPVATDAPPALVRRRATRHRRDGSEPARLDRLEVKAGEIVGIAGVEGNGQSQLGAVLAGLLSPTHGKFMVHGRDVTTAKPRALTQAGVGVVPETGTPSVASSSSASPRISFGIARSLLSFRHPRARRDVEGGRIAHEEVRRARACPDLPMSSLFGRQPAKSRSRSRAHARSSPFSVAAQPTRGLDVGAVEAVFVEIRRRAIVARRAPHFERARRAGGRVRSYFGDVRGRIVGQRPADRSSLGDIGAMMSGQERAA